jgi:hypothetical protein
MKEEKLNLLATVGSTYQALQQWEEAQVALAEAIAHAETIDLRPTLSRLRMHSALAGSRIRPTVML